MGLTFRRGIHPPENKELTKNLRIKYLHPGVELVYPMVQHIGAPCKPLVKKGDQVLMGQKIGEATSMICSPIHASVSGTVVAVAKRLHPNGSQVECVVVENDFEYSEIETMKNGSDDKANFRSYKKMDCEEIINKIQEGGVVGLGGAGFPTHVKLSPKDRNTIDHIIVNGAECEPYLTSDHRIMIEQTDEVVQGLKVVLKLFPNAKGVIAIEDNKPDVIKKMKEEVLREPNIVVNVLKTKFPQGAEKQMIYSVTHREVPSGKLPSEVGCIVHNIDTIVAIYRSVQFDRPLMHRIITVSGKNIKHPSNFKVHIGTSYREVMDAAGGLANDEGMVITGGPMMGSSLYDLNVPTIKTSSSIVCFKEEELNNKEEGNCIRCNKCVEVCPMGLLPNQLDTFARNGMVSEFEDNFGLDCMECASCSYTCPAKRELVQSIRTTKRKVVKLKRK